MTLLPPSKQPVYFQAVPAPASPTPFVPSVDFYASKGLLWSGKDDATRLHSRSADPSTEIKSLSAAIQADLNKLRQLHQVLMNSKYFGKNYQAENKEKDKEYEAISERVRAILMEEPSELLLNELEKITLQISLSRTYIDALFPQIRYEAQFVVYLMKSEIEDIKFQHLKTKAALALKRIETLAAELNAQLQPSQEEPIQLPQGLHIIFVFDEMRKYQRIIETLKESNEKMAHNIRKNVLVGIAITFLSVSIAVILLWYFGVQWKAIRLYPILGIPMGIVIWSFFGSFAAMLSQFYQKQIYEFGNVLKWVVIRPILGVVMGATIYLALASLGIVTINQLNSLLPLLIAFFVGYSDTFTFDLLNTIQKIITGMFNIEKEEKAPTVYMLPATPNHPAVVPTEKVPTDTTKEEQASTDIPVRPNIPITNPNQGEDE